MGLKKVLSLKKKQPKCRRNTVSTLADIRNAPIPKVGETYFAGRGKRRNRFTITRVFNHPKSGPLVEYEVSNGDMGVCLAHYWWDKVKEAKEDSEAA